MSHARLLLSFILISVLAVSSAGTTGVALAAPAPEASFNPDYAGDTLIGADFELEVTFDNTAAVDSANAGYAPFIDVYFPVNGADGAAGTSLPLDGVDYVPASATYLGVAVEENILTFPASPLGGACGASQSAVSHPYAVDSTGAPVTVCGTPGDKLVVFKLPFASFTPEQPAATIHFQASLHEYADAGVPLTLFARGGFAYGLDALNNPLTDPSLFEDATPATMEDNAAGVINPTPIKIKKINSAPEDEVATGPNNGHTYTVKVKVAPGQTISNLDVTDYLDDNIVVTNITAAGASGITLNGGAVTYPFGPVVADGAANKLVVSYASINADTEFEIDYYVPLLDAGGADVVDPDTAAKSTTENRVNALGDWTPTDPRDSAGTDNAAAGDQACPACDPLVTHTNEAITIQKSVENLTDSEFTPGDTLEYTLDIQVSDYFALDDVYVYDLLHDGLRLTGTPQISIMEHGFTYDGDIDSGNYEERQYFTGGTHTLPDYNVPEAAAGDTVLFFDVSSEINYRLSYPVLGGCAPYNSGAGTGGGAPDCDAFNEGATTITITYQAVIQDSFANDFPSGDASVDEGDKLQNQAYIEAEVILNVEDLTPNGETSEAYNETEECFIIEKGHIEKTIYAHTDAETSVVTINPADPVQVTPGDVLTFRLRYFLPSSDFEDFAIYDYLPLPILDANELTAFDDSISNGTTLPPAGTMMWGPTGETDTNTNYAAFGSNLPDVAVPGDSIPSECGGADIDASENYFVFCLGDDDDSLNRESVVDVLFSVTVTDFPYQDNAVLNNLAVASLGSTNNGYHYSASLAKFTLREPNLLIRKGVASTSEPAEVFTETPNANLHPAGDTNPVPFTGNIESALGGGNGEVDLGMNADVSNITPAALVRYVITVQNAGGSSAFDVSLSDTLPAGWTCNAASLNFKIALGDGSAVTYNPLGSSDPCDFFTNFDVDSADGIALTDGSGGLLASPYENPATAVLVITYELTVPGGLSINSSHTNTAALLSYAGAEGAQNHLDLGGARTDTATVSIPYYEVSHVFMSTAARDGWILKPLNPTNWPSAILSTGPIMAGDNKDNRQARSILSFSTQDIPNNAVLLDAKLQLRPQKVQGTNPFTTHGSLYFDIRKGSFGTSSLQKSDFSATATRSKAGVVGSTKVGDWYIANFNAAARNQISLTGLTQLRLYFNREHNSDNSADYILFYGGESGLFGAPRLIVTYYVP